jgi:hypothetical protein
MRACVIPTSSPGESAPKLTGPGSRTTQTMREENARKVSAYDTRRWMLNVNGSFNIRRWYLTSISSQDGCGASIKKTRTGASLAWCEEIQGIGIVTNSRVVDSQQSLSLSHFRGLRMENHHEMAFPKKRTVCSTWP